MYDIDIELIEWLGLFSTSYIHFDFELCVIYYPIWYTIPVWFRLCWRKSFHCHHRGRYFRLNLRGCYYWSHRPLSLHRFVSRACQKNIIVNQNPCKNYCVLASIELLDGDTHIIFGGGTSKNIDLDQLWIKLNIPKLSSILVVGRISVL